MLLLWVLILSNKELSWFEFDIAIITFCKYSLQIFPIMCSCYHMVSRIIFSDHAPPFTRLFLTTLYDSCGGHKEDALDS